MIQSIKSIKDDRISQARDVKSRKGRHNHQRMLLEGEEIIDWAIKHALSLEYILVSDKEASTLGKKYLGQDYKIFTVSEGILKKVTDTNYLIPVVGVAQIPIKKTENNSQFTIVLDNVQDFGNIGTIIRTCQAFGIRDLVSTTSDIDIYNRKTIEASRGTVFSTYLDIFASSSEAIKYLRDKGYQIIATSPKGNTLQSLVELKPQPVALVVGNETYGVNPEIERQADFLVQIPMQPTVESLNVGVAAGISIYEIKLKQALTMIEEKIKSTLGREVNVLAMLVQRVLDKELKKASDLSSQQVIFMMVLKCDGTMQIADMCKQFGVLESESMSFLKPMLESGLIVTEEGIQLTRKGEEVLSKLWLTVERAEALILSELTAQTSLLFFGQLRSIQERCLQILNGN